MRPTSPLSRVAGTAGEVITLERATAPGTIRVLLAHSESLVRAGLRALLEGQDDVSVVGEAAGAQDAVDAAATSLPDVVLLDVALAGIGAMEATRRIVAASDGARTRVIILSSAEDTHFFDALHAGASGFLIKDTSPAELLHAIRCVAQGHALLAPSVTRRLIEEFASQPDLHRPVPERLQELTPREREVMGLVAMAFTNEEIATRLVISPATAKTHVRRAMVKLHARDRAHLVTLAYQSQLVEPKRSTDCIRRRIFVSAA